MTTTLQLYIFYVKRVNMSEWLRRQTRNLLGYACVGSNPTIDEFLALFHIPVRLTMTHAQGSQAIIGRF